MKEATRKRWIAVSSFAAVLAISFAATVRPHWFGWVARIPLGDKIGHFFVYGLLTLAILYYAGTTPRRIGYGVLGMLVFVSADEALQAVLPTRSFDGFDYLASVLGVVAFAFGYIWAMRRRS
ncbi:MAG: VanZ family protein [Rhodothermales bacterium]